MYECIYACMSLQGHRRHLLLNPTFADYGSSALLTSGSANRRNIPSCPSPLPPRNIHNEPNSETAAAVAAVAAAVTTAPSADSVDRLQPLHPAVQPQPSVVLLHPLANGSRIGSSISVQLLASTTDGGGGGGGGGDETEAIPLDVMRRWSAESKMATEDGLEPSAVEVAPSPSKDIRAAVF